MDGKRIVMSTTKVQFLDVQCISPGFHLEPRSPLVDSDRTVADFKGHAQGSNAHGFCKSNLSALVGIQSIHKVDIVLDIQTSYGCVLQDYVPEDIESISGFESPQSPESSYNNFQPGSEDYAKEPPLVPPHLQSTLLNVPSSYMEIPPPFSRPQHVVLNHLYMQKGRSSPSVVALEDNSSQSRFDPMVTGHVHIKGVETAQIFSNRAPGGSNMLFCNEFHLGIGLAGFLQSCPSKLVDLLKFARHVQVFCFVLSALNFRQMELWKMLRTRKCDLRQV
ncbi:hypothetical protein RHSIM_Rhsim13G0141300 [Rhododendron simsii]|uniref:Association with the SNF1 complex (ASC) domain-containing protein n=1 Tax=Rhododendron simsii TaxID=118357 RepID=A0A834G1L0_RHOSS|nr:hypothetical protein RHSIM_Rhsim13G0141300 [Rhododendron simsii]